MNNKDFLIEVIKRGSNADKGYFEFVHIAAVALPKELRESLKQLVNGPVFDGDVISKSLISELFDYGLAVRVCVNGEQGYTGATYFSYSVNKRIDEIKQGKVSE